MKKNLIYIVLLIISYILTVVAVIKIKDDMNTLRFSNYIVDETYTSDEYIDKSNRYTFSISKIRVNKGKTTLYIDIENKGNDDIGLFLDKVSSGVTECDSIEPIIVEAHDKMQTTVVLDKADIKTEVTVNYRIYNLVLDKNTLESNRRVILNCEGKSIMIE